MFCCFLWCHFLSYSMSSYFIFLSMYLYPFLSCHPCSILFSLVLCYFLTGPLQTYHALCIPYYSHWTPFLILTPHIIIFQHALSLIKRLIQMMCGLSDMLLVWKRGGESLCSEQLEGAFSACSTLSENMISLTENFLLPVFLDTMNPGKHGRLWKLWGFWLPKNNISMSHQSAWPQHNTDSHWLWWADWLVEYIAMHSWRWYTVMKSLHGLRASAWDYKTPKQDLGIDCWTRENDVQNQVNLYSFH